MVDVVETAVGKVVLDVVVETEWGMVLDVVEVVVEGGTLLDVVVTVDVVVVGETREREATASSRPAPAIASRPAASTSTAPPWRAARRPWGESVGAL